MSFRPPKPAESLRAIGKTEKLPLTLRRGLDPGTDFELIPIPQPGDWLAEHSEPGQTFRDFRRGKHNVPDSIRNKIHLQPLGPFAARRSPSLKALKAYTRAFFMMDVEILPPLEPHTLHIRKRRNPISGRPQVLTTDVLKLLKNRLAHDAFCGLAITMEDLYPSPLWNFVFGQASLTARVGVFSFARYDPAFYGEKGSSDDYSLLLNRSCKVLAHETAHMFSLAHCIYFRCVMNGSNHLKESDSRPLFLCPVCLRKLQASIGFDMVERYRKLLAFYQDTRWGSEAGWVSRRLKRIAGSAQEFAGEGESSPSGSNPVSR